MLGTPHDNNSPGNNCRLQDTSPKLDATTAWKEDEIMTEKTTEDLTEETTEDLMDILGMAELWTYGGYGYGPNDDMSWQEYQGSMYDPES